MQTGHAGLRGYHTGLMLPLTRKSVEPMDPMHMSARHQSLRHFVAKAKRSDEEMLRRVAQWVVPRMDFSEGDWWIVDDTGFPKKGRRSVVSRASTPGCRANKTIARSSSASPWPASRAACSWPGSRICRKTGQQTSSGVSALVSPMKGDADKKFDYLKVVHVFLRRSNPSSRVLAPRAILP